MQKQKKLSDLTLEELAYNLNLYQNCQEICQGFIAEILARHESLATPDDIPATVLLNFFDWHVKEIYKEVARRSQEDN